MNDQEKLLQRRIIETVNAQIQPRIYDSAVPIAVAQNAALRQHGTGTLFRVADHFFLVTAGHVFGEASKYKLSLGIGGSRDGHFIPLEGQSLVASEPHDIGLHRLHSDAVDRLTVGRFLSFNDIEIDQQSPTAVYTIFGFPCVWSSPSNVRSRCA